MDDFSRPREQERINEFEDQPVDLPEAPRTTEELTNDVKIEEFVSTVRRLRNITKDLDKSIYRKLTIDEEGYVSYNHKRISLKKAKDIASIKTLEKSPDGREFLRKLGLDKQESVTEQPVATDRDLQTVSP